MTAGTYPPGAPCPPGTPCWVDLVATDRDLARTFYGQLFGWEFTEGHATDAPYLLARQDGRTVAGISSFDGALPPGWVTYFACADAGELATKVAAAGGQVLQPPLDEAGDGRVVVFRDPLGALAGGWQAGRVNGAEVTGVPNSLIRAELSTPEVNRAAEFYATSLGVYVAQPNEADQRAIYADGQLIGYIHPSDMRVTRWLPCFGATDAQATVRRALDLGASLIPDRAQPGRTPGVRDPLGANFRVVEL